MTEQVNINDSFLATTQAINALDIPDISEKEKAIRFVRAAQNMIRFQLETRDLEGAKETLDKVEAVEGYFAKKTNGQKKLVDRLSKKYGHKADAPELQRELEKLHKDRITQNIVAEGRIRSIRDIGDWAIIWMDHGTNKTGGGVDVEEKRTNHVRPIDKDDLIKQSEILAKFLISPTTLGYWQQLAGIEDSKFEEFIAPFTDETILNNIELNYTLAVRLFKYNAGRGHVNKHNLTPQLMNIAVALDLLVDRIDSSQREIDKGNLPPINQMQTIREMFKDTVEHINKYIRHTSERY